MTSAEMSYALVALPGEAFRLFRDNGGDSLRSDDVFVAVPWNTGFADGYTIRDTECELEPGLTDCELAPLTQSTDCEEYLRQLSTLIETLKKTGGKTVISAVICGTFAGQCETTLNSIIQYLHGAPTNCYRCLFHTPRTGTWLIVSPETLADVDLWRRRLCTMSLAGTRPVGTGGEWDAKNRDEQAMVTGFILDCLEANGVSYITTKTGTRRASAVEHIITEIEGRICDGFDYMALLDSLSPTPALCGLPREESLRRIAEIERHPRRMYGGYTAVIENGTRIFAAVTLRCAQIDSSRWCIYTGSGITGASEPAAEWGEIALKARPLTNLFESSNPLNEIEKSDKPGRPFAAVIMAVLLLAALSLVPWSRITNGVLKDFSLLSQILPDSKGRTEATAVESVDPSLAKAVAELDKVAEAASDTTVHDEGDEFYNNFSVPVVDGKVIMEDYTATGTGAANLRRALAEGRKARIAVIGDSYIEGDIFTQHVREALQKRHGGTGVGYMPMYSELTGFRTSVRQSCQNWKESDIRKANNSRYNWLAGEYFVAEPGATTTFKGSSKLAGLSSWENTRILYMADAAGCISISTDAGEYNFEVTPSDGVAIAEVPGHTGTASVTTNVPGLVVLGAFLDGSRGVQLDNMSLRGNSGQAHRNLNIDLANRMRAYVDYDLVVIEYGINALTAQQTEYHGYSRILGQIIDRVRQCYPKADIVMMGIGDRGQKINGNVASLATAPAMVRAQRDAARRKGVIFWDTRAAMGGENSVVDWRDRGLINADYIHLNAKGGKELAGLFVNALEYSLYPPTQK